MNNPIFSSPEPTYSDPADQGESACAKDKTCHKEEEDIEDFKPVFKFQFGEILI